ncbi:MULTISPECIES: SPOR domain-containing protein [unclassified Lysobacter]|uniref:SPOR domain-containing protein n=1 Tax=unclassified Lysobacter TaxID=2635362 RepID=UPI0006FF3B33|nr:MULTISPECIES: SPOR domain-containing protein [unclassified Lysobacter]KQZ66245.1 sporulation protein [Lysobacter sp. Root559]KRC30947.1 sporulation protein [Lysobacter sp. Root76]KRD67735.1 sporulation protein [Lysobacter sp. Root96]
MEPALKQRLIGAAVLVALAVIFLPMLIKGPAPESSASDVPLNLPEQPDGQFETRELPLVTPGDAPSGGVVGMSPGAAAAQGETLPTVDTAAEAAKTAATGAMPATAAGGDFAVSFGSYAGSGDADRVVAALRGAQLPGYQEAVPGNGRTLYRVRIGPYGSRADAETARLASAKVRNDISAKVVTLDADAAPPAASAPASQPVAAATPPVSAAVPLADSRPATKPAALPPEPAKPAPKPAAATPKPAAAPAKPPVAAAPKPVEPAKPAAAAPAPTKPAASDTGFAVQLGAFGSAEEANKLRDRARAAGFSAFVEQVRTDKGTLSRVRLGPVANRADADKLKSQAAAKIGVDGFVRPHP